MPSHLHRSSSFQFPRGPPSPPDTNTETIVPGMPVPILPSSLSAGPEFNVVDGGFAHPSPDFPATRTKKSSSLPYHLSGLRDVKDRPSSTPPKGPKCLIIVIPPSALFNERTSTHPMNNGSHQRLSQGIIMPLFPSMFGQLTAIAREFGFPSTSGICLYFHYVEGDIVSIPRITDESWPVLWSHFSDPAFSSERRALVSGKIEFDIDHRLARWYGPWLSSFVREASDASMSYPHTAPHGHFRGESRTTTDGRFFDEENGEGSAIQQHSAPVRLVPRKLSLVERFESPAFRPDVRPVPLSLGTPPESIPAVSQALSPIRQEDEPKSARQDLNSRVKSWRASAQLGPTPLAATGQTSLEPPNLPNTMVLNSDGDAEGKSLRMEDFAWSISSAGPQSEGAFPQSPWFHSPSVHLDSRLVGSVCSTPSVQTSAGPLDYAPFSTGPSQYARIPSPDIAHRLYENGMDSPLTATTWGPPLSYPPSPELISRLPSPDIGHRHFEYVPDSPMTATTWGAPLSYPPSPICLSPVPSLDLGERATFDDIEASYQYSLSLDPRAHTTTPSKPWSHVWPYTFHENASSRPTPLSQANIALDDEKMAEGTLGWRQVWPYNSHSIDAATKLDILKVHINYRQVWPYNSHSINTAAINRVDYQHPTSQPSFIYPFICIYRPAYPYFDIYPAVHRPDHPPLSNTRNVNKGVQDARLRADYPSIYIYADVYPYNLDSIYPIVHQQVKAGYPQNLQEIYPIVSRLQEGSTHGEASDKGYPHNLGDIYSPVARVVDDKLHEGDTVHSQSICNGQHLDYYPYFNLYPCITAPFFAYLSLQIYGPKSQYPDFEIYPSIPTHTSRRLVTPTRSKTNVYPVSDPVYPTFNLYPAVYPFFNLYPSINVSVGTTSRAVFCGSTRNQSPVWQYPYFNMYPAVYPHFDLYPVTMNQARLLSTDQLDIHKEAQVQVALSTSSYPHFNLYPRVYPFLSIYPETYAYGLEKKPEASNPTLVDVGSLRPTLAPTYPSFNLYPGVYPCLDIYPAPYGFSESHYISPVSNVVTPQTPQFTRATYPCFILYPNIYPYFDLYPSVILEGRPIYPKVLEPITVHPNYQYPTFNLYPAVYPNFDIYPYLPLDTAAPVKAVISSRLTHAELHAMVMMEKFGTVGSFGYMERGSSSFGNETYAPSRAAFLNGKDNFDSGSASPRTTYTTSSASVSFHESPRVPIAFRGSAYMSQDVRSVNGSHRTNEVPAWQISRSRSLRLEPDAPLPPRPTSVAQGREPTRLTSTREQIHSRTSTIGLPPRPSPRKRDSLVLQRVKAFDSNGEAVAITKDTLSKFPMPPKFPLPPLPLVPKDNLGA